jgi:hypothetical protein
MRRAIAMMTQPWEQIVAHYEEFQGEHQSIRALETLTRRISESSVSKGLFAWTSMFDLCIVQKPVSYPHDGPWLRISPISKDQVEFRYLDTFEKAQQWHRSVDADQVWPRLIKFLDQLRWFSTDVLVSVSADTRF